MSTFQEYHGISLAQNSFIENLFVEQLAEDPVPVGPGRVWYNTTVKVYRQSTLNASGAVVVKTFATIEDLQADIDNVNADLTSVQAEVDNIESAMGAIIDSAGNYADQGFSNAKERTSVTGVLSGFNSAISATASVADNAAAGLAQEIIDRVAADTTLQAAIDAEAAARTAADVTAAAALAQEVLDRQAGDAANATAIGDEVTARTAAVTAVETNLASEVTARTAADSSLQVAIDDMGLRIDSLGNVFTYVGGVTGGVDEAGAFDLSTLPISDQEAGDYHKVTTAGWFKLDTAPAFYANYGDGLVFNSTGDIDKIDNTDSNVSGTAGEIVVIGSADTGFVVSIEPTVVTKINSTAENLTGEIKNRSDADAALQATLDGVGADLQAETDARVAADATIQASVAAEITARTAADATLTASIASTDAALAAEVTARVAADATAAAALAAEVTARTAADATISANIGSLAALSTTDKSSIVSAINEVKTLAGGGGVDALKTQLNSSRYTTTTVTPATSHTITHSLGTTMVDVCVWIDRGDGVWRNDMAGVSIVDTNSIKVDLTAARNIRVTVENMNDLA